VALVGIRRREQIVQSPRVAIPPLFPCNPQLVAALPAGIRAFVHLQFHLHLHGCLPITLSPHPARLHLSTRDRENVLRAEGATVSLVGAALALRLVSDAIPNSMAGERGQWL
jgi:hypothetical protein